MDTAVAPLVILVVGRPASGKTSSARRIAERFELPLLAKDAFKEILFDRLGSGDRARSVELGRAAFDLLDHAVEQQLRGRGPFVIEAPLDARFEDLKYRSWQRQFGFRALQVHCVASDAVLLHRFVERSRSGLRHTGHADDESIEEFRASLRDGRTETLSLDGEVITVDLTRHGELDQALLRIASALSADPRPAAAARPGS